MRKHNVWLIIPAYNEQQYLAKVLAKVKRITPYFVVVDDGSSDESAQIARRFTSHVLTHRINLGKGAALKTGCDYAFGYLDAQGVVFIDSDDQHDPAEVNLFYQALSNKAQVVFGERAMNSSMPLARIMGNRLASFLVMFLFGSYLPDIPSGFKALSKQAYEQVRWQASGYDVELEIAARVAKNRLAVTVVPISTIYHDFSRGMTLLDVVQVVVKLINLKVAL